MVEKLKLIPYLKINETDLKNNYIIIPSNPISNSVWVKATNNCSILISHSSEFQNSGCMSFFCFS